MNWTGISVECRYRKFYKCYCKKRYKEELRFLGIFISSKCPPEFLKICPFKKKIKRPNPPPPPPQLPRN